MILFIVREEVDYSLWIKYLVKLGMSVVTKAQPLKSHSGNVTSHQVRSCKTEGRYPGARLHSVLMHPRRGWHRFPLVKSLEYGRWNRTKRNLWESTVSMIVPGRFYPNFQKDQSNTRFIASIVAVLTEELGKDRW